jgi:hypothetical protein
VNVNIRNKDLDELSQSSDWLPWDVATAHRLSDSVVMTL